MFITSALGNTYLQTVFHCFIPFLYFCTNYFYIFNGITASANMHHNSALATFHINGDPNTDARKGNSDLDTDQIALQDFTAAVLLALSQISAYLPSHEVRCERVINVNSIQFHELYKN